MSSNSDPAGGSEADFLARQDLLKAKMNDPAAAPLNLTTDEKAAITSDNALIHDKKDTSDQADAVAKQTTQEKNNAFALAKKNYRTLRKNLMSRPGYNRGIGELLGLEGPEVIAGESLYVPPDKPTAKVAALADYHASVKPLMKGAQAVDISCQRDGDAAPVLLGRVTHAHFIDARGPLVAGKPEKRNYFIQLVRNDEHWGPISDPISVICSG